MGTIILIALLIWSVFSRIKYVFVKQKPMDMQTYLKHDDPQKAKTILYTSVILVFIIQAIIPIWGSLFVGSGILIIGAAVTILLMIKEDTKITKQVSVAIDDKKDVCEYKRGFGSHLINFTVLAYDSYLFFSVLVIVAGI